MQITAKLNNLRISPRKVRLTANLIKGMDVSKAVSQLKFLNKRSAQPILKLVNAALSNAKHNFNLSPQGLYIAGLKVDEGRRLKRWLPRAFGRATPILKRSSHITIILDSEKRKEESEKIKKVKESKPYEIMRNISQGKQIKTIKQEFIPQKREIITALKEKIKEEKDIEQSGADKERAAKRPYKTSAKAKKRFFSRQTFGNIKKVFRRKSI